MGTRLTGRSRPEGEAVRRPGVRVSGLEGEGAKGSRVPSGAKRRTGHGDRRGGASRMCRPDEGKKDARGRLSPTKEESGGPEGAPMSRRAERPRVCGRGADCVNARDPVRPNEVRSLRERAMKKRPEGQGSQRAASVCRRPGAQHRVDAAERSVRWCCGRGAGPQRQRTGSPNGVRSAGTGERESTACWRDGPVAAQRSSGSSRRQEGVILTSPVPGASKRSEVAPGTGRLQRTKPEGRGGLAA